MRVAGLRNNISRTLLFIRNESVTRRSLNSLMMSPFSRLRWRGRDAGYVRYRTYPASRPRQRSLLNGDIIKLFKDLRVTDSFLMKSKVREMLFRKPAPRG